MRVAMLVISGSMGAGKTTVLGEASDLLTAAGIAHAAIDLDTLAMGHLPEDLTERNLAGVWRNYAAAGVMRLLLAEADPDLQRLRRSVPDADIIVCRLRASIETMQQRVRVREPGLKQAEFVQRVVDLERTLQPGHFSVDNDGRDVTDVARELLARAGWL
jgi:adenylylsulfate kinase